MDGAIPEKSKIIFSILKRFVLSFFLIAIYIGSNSLDPFGLEDLANDLSTKTFTNIISPFYGKYDGTSDFELEREVYKSRQIQDDILVVLIGDNDGIASQWPVHDLRKFSRPLRRLEENGAALTFLDIYFDDRIPSGSEKPCRDTNSVSTRHDQLQSLLTFAGGLKMPVIFGELLGHRLNTTPVDCVTGVQHVIPIDTALIESRANAGFYKLYHKEAGSSGISGVRNTPAMAMYLQWCRQHSDACQRQLSTSGRKEHDEMFLYWGFAPNELMVKETYLGGQDCVKGSYGFWGNLVQSFRLLIRSVTHSPNDAAADSRLGDERLCPYHMQIGWDRLFSLNDEEFRSLVGGRMILIGTSLSKHPDWQYSPVHGYLPGVFYHAMALDNLIAFQENYIRSSVDLNGAHHFPVFLLVLQTSVGIFIQFLRGAKADKNSIHRINWVFGIFSAVLVSTCVWYVSSFKNSEPGNWIGLATLLLVLGLDSGGESSRYEGKATLAQKLFGVWSKSQAITFEAMIKQWFVMMEKMLFPVVVAAIGFCLVVIPQSLRLQRFNAFIDRYDYALMFFFMGLLLVLLVFLVLMIVRSGVKILRSKEK